MKDNEFGKLSSGTRVTRTKPGDEFHAQTGIITESMANSVKIRWDNGTEQTYPLTEAKHFERVRV